MQKPRAACSTWPPVRASAFYRHCCYEPLRGQQLFRVLLLSGPLCTTPVLGLDNFSLALASSKLQSLMVADAVATIALWLNYASYPNLSLAVLMVLDAAAVGIAKAVVTIALNGSIAFPGIGIQLKSHSAGAQDRLHA